LFFVGVLKVSFVVSLSTISSNTPLTVITVIVVGSGHIGSVAHIKEANNVINYGTCVAFIFFISVTDNNGVKLALALPA
jgi:hypothetical protein